MREVPAGTVLRVLPLKSVALPSTGAEKPGEAEARNELGITYCDALFRETLRQSVRFDVASGLEDGPSAFEVEVTHDGAAATLVATLRGPGMAPATLGLVRIASGALPAAIDQLARSVLAGLGESPPVVTLGSALCYSAEPACVRYCERALKDASRGDTTSALGWLKKARPLDPGCTQVLAALAALHLERGELVECEKAARDGLQLERRLSVTTKHRLARSLLRARDDDQGLLDLAEVTLRERPHDSQVLWSKALALSLLGRSPEALPLLRALATRWPVHGAVRWHLCLAELAGGDPVRALDAIEAAGSLLPRGATLRPRCLALFHAGRHAELAALLREAAASARDDGSVHEIARMRASHAILTGDKAAASRLLQEDLAWLVARPSGLEARALDLVENGESLIRLGNSSELASQLAIVEGLRPMPALVGDALTYLGALVAAATDRQSTERAEAALRSGGRTGWSGMLRAAVHHRNGELQDEAEALTEVVQATDAALARAGLARVLRVSGQQREADLLLADLRKRLLVFAPRQLGQHPLLSPSRALAWIATEQR